MGVFLGSKYEKWVSFSILEDFTHVDVIALSDIEWSATTYVQKEDLIAQRQAYYRHLHTYRDTILFSNLVAPLIATPMGEIL